jgi:hypothetical protein
VDAKKTCHVCGADVTHADRHKNRQGQYRCDKCMDAKKRRLSKGGLRTLTRKKLPLIALCALAALAASWIFLHLLAIMNQPPE